jgi:xanthosine utilization system XapX-like protein
MIEIHLPHPAPPLIAALEAIGIDCVLNELSPDHYRLLALKL